MAHLLYFVEHCKSVKRPAELAELGLDYAFAPGLPVCRPNESTGPGETHGVCLGRSADRIGYYADQQTWLRLPPLRDADGQPKSDAPARWVGFWNDARPTPAELLVEEPLRGHAVRCRDGQHWIAPIALCCDADSAGQQPEPLNALPCTLQIDDAGEWTSGGIDRRYQRLWDVATGWWDHLHAAAGSATMTFSGAALYDHALTVLQANYRLTRAEVALLGLMDTQGYVATELLKAAIDMPTWVEWFKKKDLPLPPGI